MSPALGDAHERPQADEEQPGGPVDVADGHVEAVVQERARVAAQQREDRPEGGGPDHRADDGHAALRVARRAQRHDADGEDREVQHEPVALGPRAIGGVRPQDRGRCPDRDTEQGQKDRGEGAERAHAAGDEQSGEDRQRRRRKQAPAVEVIQPVIERHDRDEARRERCQQPEAAVVLARLDGSRQPQGYDVHRRARLGRRAHVVDWRRRSARATSPPAVEDHDGAAERVQEGGSIAVADARRGQVRPCAGAVAVTVTRLRRFAGTATAARGGRRARRA